MTRVIVIDDDPDTVEVFSEYLELKGVVVVGTSYDGLQALGLYKKHRPDIVLVDTIMGTHDGFFVLKEIRKYDQDAKIILVTGDLSLATRERVKESSASGIISKPFDIENVMNVIEQAKSGQNIMPKFRFSSTS